MGNDGVTVLGACRQMRGSARCHSGSIFPMFLESEMLARVIRQTPSGPGVAGHLDTRMKRHILILKDALSGLHAHRPWLSCCQTAEHDLVLRWLFL